MVNRTTAAFVFSVIGATYQIISLGVAALIDRGISLYFYIFGLNSLVLTGLVVFWSASHILEDWKGRITWPSIILALAIANLSSIILAYFVTSPYATLSVWVILALIPGPLLTLIGGILGFAAVRQYSSEHGRGVTTRP